MALHRDAGIVALRTRDHGAQVDGAGMVLTNQRAVAGIAVFKGNAIAVLLALTGPAFALADASEASVPGGAAVAVVAGGWRIGFGRVV